MKKFKVFLLLIGVMGSGILRGDTYTIVDGATTTYGKYHAVGSYSSYLLSEYIYLASEITAAGGGAGNITQIAFEAWGTGSYTCNNLEVFVGHTSSSTLSGWIASGSLTQVYGPTNTTITKSSGGTWNTITLSTPFAYNGSDNLVIMINHGSTAPNYCLYNAVGSSTNYRHIYAYGSSAINDGSPPSGTRNNQVTSLQLEISSAGPTAPSGCSATDYTDCDKVVVTWTDNSDDEDSFRIYRNSSIIGLADAEAETYDDATAVAGTQYTYYVTAKNESGESSASNSDAGTRKATPTAPDGCSATDSYCDSIVITWNDNSSTAYQEDSFRIYRDGSVIGLADADDEYYKDTPPGAGPYTYTVSAKNSCGASAQSGSNAGSCVKGAPTAPDGCSASDSYCDSIVVTWNDNSSNEDSFRIYRAGSVIGLADAGSEHYKDTPPGAGPYTYTVSAKNICGASAQSAGNDGTCLTTPTAPDGCSATDSYCDSIVITWNDNSSNEDSFRIYRAGSVIGLADAGSEYYKDTPPSTGPYNYTVSAKNSCGASSQSGANAGSCVKATPTAPDGCSASDSYCDSIVITWNDNSSNEDSFRIYRNGSVIGLADANAEYYKDTPSAGTYSYTVSAKNVCGASSQSAANGGTCVTDAPTAPDGCLATDSYCDSIVITWNDNSSNEDSFRIYRNGSVIGLADANSEHYKDTPSAGTYTYKVSAKNVCGESSHSGTDSGTRESTPTAPSGCNATDSYCDSIVVTWTDNSSNEDSFRIYRAGSIIGLADANATYYKDTPSAGTYSYTVSAKNVCGASSQSAANSGTCVTDAPTAPSGCSASDNYCDSVVVTWTDNSSNEDSFRIYRAGSVIGLADANATYYKDTPSAGTYAYKVSAKNACGASAASAEDDGVCVTDAPTAPSGCNATDSYCDSIVVTWTDNSSNEDSFRIYRAGSVIGLADANATYYKDTPSAGTYSYTVSAKNVCGASSQSAANSGTCVTDVPTAPSGCSATDSYCDSIVITWTDNSSNEDSFRIYRAGSVIGLADANATYYKDTPSEGTYAYTVSAKNVCGASSQSAADNGTCVTDVPTAPSGCDASDAYVDSIVITWTDNSSNEDSFRIYRDGSVIGLADADAEYYKDTPEAGTYTYKVSAKNACGESSHSATNDGTCTASSTTYTIIEGSSHEYPHSVGNDMFSYFLTEYIYTKAEIDAGTGGGMGTISGLWYDAYKSSDGSYTCNNLEIWMGHTDRTAFADEDDWISSDSLTLVYSGSPTITQSAAGTWNQITLDNEFIYNDVDNLVIMLNHGPTATLKYIVYGTETGNRHLAKNNTTAISDQSPPTAGTFNANLANLKVDWTETSAIIVASPDGGEQWIRSEDYDISWTSGGITGDVNIDLYKAGVKVTDIATVAYNSSPYEWTIGAGEAIADDYKIKITSESTPAVSDQSDDYFSIIIEEDTTGQYYGELGYGTANTNDDDYLYAVEAISDGYVIAGYGSASKNILYRMDENSDIVWQKTYGSLSSQFHASICANETYYALTGFYFRSGETFSDCFVVKIDASDGSDIWTMTYGGDYESQGYGIELTSDNYYVTCGHFSTSTLASSKDAMIIKIDPSDGDTVWARRYACSAGSGSDRLYDIVQDGSYYVGVGQCYVDANGQHPLIMKVSATDGTVSWAKRFDPDPNTTVGGLVNEIIVDGSYYVMTGTTGNGDIFVMKIGSDGNVIWTKNFGHSNGAYIENGAGITKTSTGRYVITGSTDAPMPASKGRKGKEDIDDDVLVLKMFVNGVKDWAIQTGADGDPDAGAAVVEAHDGSYLIAGYNQFWAFYKDPEPSQHADDGFIARVRTDGTLPDDCNWAYLDWPLSGVSVSLTDVTMTPYAGIVPVSQSAPDGDASFAKYEICGEPFAIQLASFCAEPGKGYVELNWKTELEVDNYKWIIARSNDKNKAYNKVGELPAKGYPSIYTYLDSTVIPGITYWYKLGDMDKNGVISWNGPISVTAGLEVKFPLSMKIPGLNPSKGEVKIDYSVPGKASGIVPYVNIVIYNSAGQIVKVLVSERQKPGYYNTKWDGKDEKGVIVSTGSYFCRLKTDGKLSWKLIRIK